MGIISIGLQYIFAASSRPLFDLISISFRDFRILYFTIIKLGNIIYGFLRRPYEKFNFICYIIFKLEISSEIPFNSASFSVVFGCFCTSCNRIPLLSVSIVLEAVFINANYRSFGSEVCETCDAIFNISSISKGPLNF